MFHFLIHFFMQKKKQSNGGRRYDDVAYSEFGTVQMWTRCVKVSIGLPRGLKGWKGEMRQQFRELMKQMKVQRGLVSGKQSINSKKVEDDD